MATSAKNVVYFACFMFGYIRGGVRAAFQQYLSASDISGRWNFRATPLQLKVTTQRVDWLRGTSGGEKFPPRASLFLDSVTGLMIIVYQTVVVWTSRTGLVLERSVPSCEFILDSYRTEILFVCLYFASITEEKTSNVSGCERCVI